MTHRPDSAHPPAANPDVRRPRRPGRAGPLRFAWESTVMGWRWLVRMRTALYLLALLALMSLIATVVPQLPNVPGTVEDWRTGEAGPGTAVSRLIDLVGAYDVYGSPAFLALLLLLFLSLTACLIPRVRSWVRLVTRSQPPLLRTPGSQDRVAQLVTDRSADEVHASAADLLADGHWRVRRHDPGGVDERPRRTAPPQVAAERGLWSREGGSLVFHLSFYVLLAAVVFGQLLGFTGQRAVVEGESFADTPVSYWTYGPGRWFGEDDHAGWVLQLRGFEVDWVRDPLAPGAGQPTTFRSDVTVTRADGDVVERVVEGNRPLTVDGMKIHQLDWGYAPRLEVEVDGELLHDRPLTAQFDDRGVFRAAVKIPAADPDLGLEVFLWPFAPDSDDGPVLTPAQWDDAPLLVMRQYRGDLQIGRTQQTINELDTSRMTSDGGAALRLGGEVELPGDVVVRFVDLDRWVGFQISHRPQLPWLVVASGLLLGGLLPALYAYRRRLWVTARSGGGRTLVTVAGRAFQRPQAFEAEHERITRRLAEAIVAAPPEPTEPAEPTEPTEPTEPSDDGAVPDAAAAARGRS